MKIIIAIVCMFSIAQSTNMYAQKPMLPLGLYAVTATSFLPIYMNYGDIKATVNATGATAIIPDGQGSIKMIKRGDGYAEVTHTNASRKVTRLSEVTRFPARGPKPSCKAGQSSTMYSSADGSITMMLCKLPVLADGNTALNISVVMPVIETGRVPASATH